MSSSPRQRQHQQQNRLFYRIGDVSRITDLEPYVLRYWETEFPQIRPEKGKTGQRLYKQKDVDTILLVKQLLHKEGYTIAGARKKLNSKHGRSAHDEAIDTAKRELKEILELLK